MKGKVKILIGLMAVLCLLISCGKQLPDNSNGGGGASTFSGTVASYSVIPIPTVNIPALIIPNLSQFYVTNRGAYIQVQNSNQTSWSVYKYDPSTPNNWSSFIPSFKTSYFRPVSMFYEMPGVFSIYWCDSDQSPDKYGIYSINTGTPSLNFTVPSGNDGPGHLLEIIPSTKAANTGKSWTVFENTVWRESAVVSPLKFDKVKVLPGSDQRLRIDAIMSDPDNDQKIWIAKAGKLYEVSAVGNPTYPYGSIGGSWNFDVTGSGDRISTIIKANGDIVVQFGTNIYKKNGTSFNKIGSLAFNAGTSQICTDGSGIYSSEGKYYDNTTSTWKSFLGTGTNLSPADQVKFAKLQGLFGGASPIGALRGASSPVIYLLSLEGLVQMSPKF